MTLANEELGNGQDNAKPREVKVAKKCGRATYATNEPLVTAASGILHCLKKKNAKKYEDMILVIESSAFAACARQVEILGADTKEGCEGPAICGNLRPRKV